MKVKENIEAIELTIRRISALAKERPGCIRFDIGQPDFTVPEHIKEATISAIKQDKTSYSPPYGVIELRKAIAEYESKKGIAVKAENVLVSNGGMGALFSLFLGILSKGDEIILPDPAWAAYSLQLRAVEAGVKRVPFISDKGIDIDLLRKNISPKTKLILINSPGNPTGIVLDEKSLMSLAGLAKETGIIIVSDEVYELLLFDGAEHVSIARFIPEQTIRINSTSKTFAMTGYRIGWMTAPEEIIQQLMKCSRATTACVNTFAQYGAVAALEGEQECVEEMREEYEKRYRVMISRIRRLGWECPEVKGAFYMFPKTGKDSWPYALELIDKVGVSAVPGEAFGPSGKYSMRLCFGSASIEDINEGFDRIEKYEKKN